MVCFQTQKLNLGKFWRGLYIIEKVGIFYGRGVNLVFSPFWVYILCQEKSGNPVKELDQYTLSITKVLGILNN
jgi:hypothetical protein